MADTPLGRFCWYELLTSDPEPAPGFYGAITGWGTTPFEAPGSADPYTMWTNGETPIGGLMRLPDEVAAMGAPPHWLAHISTPDVDATVGKIEEHGGRVMHREHVPTVGWFAVFQDPQGAIAAAYQPEEDAPGHDGPPGVGEFSWNELATDGWEDAWSFYSSVFGWQKDEAMDMGEMGTYQIFNRGAHQVGAVFDRPPEIPVSAWLYYVRVEDLDAALAKVTELGGRILNGPMEVPGGDRIAQCMDPQGAAFALHGSAR